MPISFSYVYGFADYRALIRIAKRPTSRQVAFRLFFMLTAYVAMMLMLGDRLRHPDGWIAMLQSRPGLLLTGATILLFVLIARFDYLLTMWLGWFWYRKLAVAGRPTTVILDEPALLWSVDGLSGRMEWPAVKRIVEERDRLVLFIGKIEGLMIPRRAFADEAAYDRAIGFVKAHVAIGIETKR